MWLSISKILVEKEDIRDLVSEMKFRKMKFTTYNSESLTRIYINIIDSGNKKISESWFRFVGITKLKNKPKVTNSDIVRKMSSIPLPRFKASDFITSKEWKTGIPNVPYIFESPTTSMKYFWEVGVEPEVRGLIGESGILHIKYPLVVKAGDKVPNPKEILNSIVTKLNRGEY